MRTRVVVFFLVALTVSCGSLFMLRPSADDWSPPVAAAAADPSPPAATCAHADPLRQAFWGDLHVHTHYSMDARSRGMMGTPDDAYRFARGEAIGFGPFDENRVGSRSWRLDRPLDFAAVTDHAEWIGEVRLCTTPGSNAYGSDACRSFRGEIPPQSPIPGMKFGGKMTGVVGAFGRKGEICGDDDANCRASLETAWQTTQRATERWNDTSETCAFTAFHGYEHSYSVNLSKVHRNVIFRNGSVPELPISSLEAPDAIDLWDRLDTLCTNAGTGCEVITIPHNPNVSNGRLFETTWRRESREEQLRQVKVRARIERLVEMMQVKGESECANGLWGVVGSEDELCGFEKIRELAEEAPDDCKDGAGWGALRGRGCRSRVDFARYALIEGMREQERLGVNPFRFGMIGSTDAHNANPGDVEEHEWGGSGAGGDAKVEARMSLDSWFAGAGNVARNPGGLVGVWAEENSRDSLFDSMVRRETFATSGPRIEPRFFGGWNLPEDLCGRRDLVSTGYAEGVPMGSILPAAGRSGGAPTFVAQVARDPGVPEHPGGQLDRLQIVKVWYGEDGHFHQAVHDVAGRRSAAAGASREAPSVDLDTCEPRGAGYDALCAVWTDPDFDASRSAAYYVRAVENPSCRWSWQTCLSLPETERPAACSDPRIPREIQERAWTSPIWYEPTT